MSSRPGRFLLAGRVADRWLCPPLRIPAAHDLHDHVLNLPIAWRYIPRGLPPGRGKRRLPKGRDGIGPGVDVEVLITNAWPSCPVRSEPLSGSRPVSPGHPPCGNKGGSTDQLGYAALRRVAGRILGCRRGPKATLAPPPLTQSRFVRQLR